MVYTHKNDNMKLNKTLIMTALVAAGLFAAGSLQAQETNKPAGDQAGMRRAPMPTLDSIAKQLDLTEDQKTKVKPTIDEMIAKLTDLQKDTSVQQADRRAKRKEIRDAAGVKLKPILTEEQYAKWEKMGQPNRRPTPPVTAPDAPAAAPKN